MKKRYDLFQEKVDVLSTFQPLDIQLTKYQLKLKKMRCVCEKKCPCNGHFLENFDLDI